MDLSRSSVAMLRCNGQRLVQVLAAAILLLLSPYSVSGNDGTFERLGAPVRQAMLMNHTVGPDASGQLNRLYLTFNQPDRVLLVATDPATGESEQYFGPAGVTAPWSIVSGPDNRVYIGASGYLLVFDPASPQEGLKNLGKPAPTETYIWRMVVGGDGKIYGCTYPNAKLVRFDPKSGTLEDLGRLHDDEQYAKPIAVGVDGWIYIGIGSKRGNVIAYHPETAERRGILPDEQRPTGWGRNAGWHLVWKGDDGAVYGEIGKKVYRLENGVGTPLPILAKAAQPERAKFEDGREVVSVNANGSYRLKDPKSGKETEYQFRHQPDPANIFSLASGPDGRIYGSSILPLVAFSYDRETGRFFDIGTVTSSGGQIYSYATIEDRLYLGVYPGGKLSRLIPSQPSKYGKSPQSNPIDFGVLDEMLSRPQAMVRGQGEVLYISGYPDYGLLGSPLVVFDTEKNRVAHRFPDFIENQSITSLAYSDSHNLLFGGTSTTGGNGIAPKEKEARFFVWDPKKNQKVAEVVPYPGHTFVASLCIWGDKVMIITCSNDVSFPTDPGSSALSVYDIKEEKVISQKLFQFGCPVVNALQLGPDGRPYGVTSQGIYTIAPDDYDFSVVKRSPVTIHRGFVVEKEGLYFSSNADLWRYRWASQEIADSSSQASTDDWRTKIRKDHPRLFFTADTLGKVRKLALGDKKKLFDADKAKVDEVMEKIAAKELLEPADYAPLAARAAFVHRVLRKGGYREAAVFLMERSLEFYEQCLKERRTASWYSTGRLHFVMAWDWLYNDLDADLRTRLMERFVDVVDGVMHAKPAIPLENLNSPTTGFYSVNSLRWYIGATTYGNGIRKSTTEEWLEEGRTDHLALLNHRAASSGKFGGAATPTLGYALGAYPWAEHNFFFTWQSATGENIALQWPHAASLADYVWWNAIRGKDALLNFGYGDTVHRDNRFPRRWVGGHLQNLYHFYGETNWGPVINRAWRMTGAGNHDADFFIHSYIVNRKMPSIDLKEESALPYAKYFDALGQVFARSGVAADATYWLFASGGEITQHRNYDALHFTIYHKGFLALDSGSQYNPAHLSHYFSQTVAHNSILIHQPGEPTPAYWDLPGDPETGNGGQHRLKGSEMKAFQSHERFVYVAGDATETYRSKIDSLPPKASEVTRQIVYLPPNHFVIYDRVGSTAPSYRKQWLLHLANEPVIIDPSTLSADHGEGRLFCRSLLPLKHRVDAVGGKGKEFFAAGRNWPLVVDPASPNWAFIPPKEFNESEKQMMGQWRIEVEPEEPSADDRFLHVIQVGDQTLEKMDATTVLEKGAQQGVQISTASGKWEILFNKSGELAGSIHYVGSEGDFTASLQEGIQQTPITE